MMQNFEFIMNKKVKRKREKEKKYEKIEKNDDEKRMKRN